MVASGFRMKHVCPFGKVVISYSDDEGKTWTRPTVVMDTPLDDRDAGILPFGENSVIITSFNNTVNMQRKWNRERNHPYINGYLDTIDWEKMMIVACSIYTAVIFSMKYEIVEDEVIRQVTNSDNSLYSI